MGGRGANSNIVRVSARESSADSQSQAITRDYLIARMNIIIANTSDANGYHYRPVVRDWQNYDKDRTYFSVVTTRDNSKMYKQTSYGYLDNQTGEYHPEKYGDLRKNYTLGGMSFRDSSVKDISSSSGENTDKKKRRR